MTVAVSHTRTQRSTYAEQWNSMYRHTKIEWNFFSVASNKHKQCTALDRRRMLNVCVWVSLKREKEHRIWRVYLPMWNWFRCYKHISKCTRIHMQRNRLAYPSKVCLCATSFASSRRTHWIMVPSKSKTFNQFRNWYTKLDFDRLQFDTLYSRGN